MEKKEVQFKIINGKRDEFGRFNGVIVADKPLGWTSHDLVYYFRRYFETKQVGHAGALDPFATGAVAILVGKATKTSDTFLHMDKEYVADFLLGIATDTLDIEGKILEDNVPKFYSQKEVEVFLDIIKENYNQTVPIYSSVKVNGYKLRELARKSKDIFFYSKDTEEHVDFILQNGGKVTIKLPSKQVNIYKASVLEEKILPKEEVELFFKNQISLQRASYQIYTISLKVSKGTYIRSVARDLGRNLHPKTGAILSGLRRNAIGEMSV